MEEKETLKAGCIFFNTNTKKVGIIFRENHNDYEFPKGHLEKNETLEECAVRETAEETKRDIKLISEFKPYDITYTTKSKERCRCFYFVGVDLGKSDNSSTDSHNLVWTDINDVENTISYQNIKIVWQHFLPQIKEYFKF